MDSHRLQSLLEPFDRLHIAGFDHPRSQYTLDELYHLVKGEIRWSWDNELTEDDLRSGDLSQQIVLRRIAHEHHAHTTYLSPLQGSRVPHQFGTHNLPLKDDPSPFPYNKYLYVQWKAVAMLLEDVGRCVGFSNAKKNEHYVGFFDIPGRDRMAMFRMFKQLGSNGIVHGNLSSHHIRIPPPVKQGLLSQLRCNKPMEPEFQYRIIDFSDSEYYPLGREGREMVLRNQIAGMEIRIRVLEDAKGTLRLWVSPEDVRQNLKTFRS